MNKEVKQLILLELRNLYGWNKFRYTKDKKEKQRYIGLTAAWIILIAMIIFYVGGLVFGLSILGMTGIVPVYLCMITSVLVFVFGFFKAGNVMFSKKGYDFLYSLPIRHTSIVLSRFLYMYIEDLLLTLLVILPGTLVYGYCVRPNIEFYLIMLIGTFFIPLLPLVLSTLIGTVIAAISSRMKHKSIGQSGLMVLLVVCIIVVSFTMGETVEEFTPEMLATLADKVNEIIGKIYAPAAWFGNAAVQGNIVEFMLFVGSSVLAALAILWLVSCKFHAISQRLNITSARHDYRMETLNGNSVLAALFKREWRRYFASSIYVTNTIIGPILGAIMAIALYVAGIDTLKNSIPFPIDIEVLIPFAFAAVFTMMTTTSVAISMEGKQFWIAKTLPIPTKMLLDSKILLNLSLMLPCYLIAEVMFILALKPNFLELLWLILIPALLGVFVVVFGITLNLKLHSFDWEKEEAVVKQSASAAIGGFGGFFISALCIGIVCIVPEQYGNLIRAVICAILLAGTVLLYRANNRANLQKL